MVIRPARLGEHVALTELALRSVQQAWGYSEEFMAWEPDAITVEPEHVTGAITNVLEAEGTILGFYVLRGEPPQMELSRLMVDPSVIGSGFGRMLWDHATSSARDRGVTTITIDSDPNAELFYRRMGAETVGEHDWEPPMMPGWRVKKMRYPIPPSADSSRAD